MSSTVIIRYTKEEGGVWNLLEVHSVGIDGEIWDAVNGWRIPRRTSQVELYVRSLEIIRDGIPSPRVFAGEVLSGEYELESTLVKKL